MKNIFYLLLLLLPFAGYAQSDQHYTMFMYNKLLFNPAYTGSRDVLSANAAYRNQWSGIDGAPKTLSVSVDGALGDYRKPFRSVAVGLSITSEKIGVERNAGIMAYYAYRIRLTHSVLSFGLEAGAKLYSANYSDLSPVAQNDPNLAKDVKNAFLPNVGTGIYWSGDNFYAGASAPSLFQNYYDKSAPKVNNKSGRQIRGYYIDGGYVLPVNETIKIEPQVMVRYAGNATYSLPLNCDLNLSAIVYDRLLVGVTYRTDKSFEAIVHMQVTKNVNIGYAYDYLLSPLSGYSNGTHELVVGFDLARDNTRYISPRFIKAF